MIKTPYDVKFFRPFELLISKTAQIRGLDNCPSDWIVYTNLYYLAYYLDSVRSKLGKPILINSGYRSLSVNKAVGGVKNSRHLQGLAVDIQLDRHNTDYGKIYQIVKDDCRYIHLYKDKHYLHVDFTREFLIHFYNNHSSIEIEK